MIRKKDDFLAEWKYESASTLGLFRLINDAALNLKTHENVRSIAVLTWHITVTLSEMLNKAGLPVSGPEENSQPPATMKEIITAYEHSSASLTNEISRRWADSNLTEEVNMYGEPWKKGTVLSVLIKHQAHHRGQLTILMRQAGLKVSGVYGPVKEDWGSETMD